MAGDGRDDTPQDAVDTARLKEYWTHGAGAAKIAWGTPNDFDRCVVQLSKYVGPTVVKGLCANMHHDALGIWPATHAKDIRIAEGKEKR